LNPFVWPSERGYACCDSSGFLGNLPDKPAMHGNVGEVVTDEINFRGAGWTGIAAWCRSSARHSPEAPQTHRTYESGFRVVCDVLPAAGDK
jgi:hypothetical protein